MKISNDLKLITSLFTSQMHMTNIDLAFITRIATAAVEAEREACIRVVERFLSRADHWTLEDVLKALKERRDLAQ